MKKNGIATEERLTPDDARVGYREVKNNKEINAACDRFLTARLPEKSKKPRRWGNY